MPKCEVVLAMETELVEGVKPLPRYGTSRVSVLRLNTTPLQHEIQ
jgi:hypothetical protein